VFLLGYNSLQIIHTGLHLSKLLKKKSDPVWGHTVQYNYYSIQSKLFVTQQVTNRCI